MKSAFLSLEKKILPGVSAGTLIVLAIMGVSLALHLYNIQAIGNANEYYTAAVKSMLQSWSNFFFVAAEPGGSVTVDKPPLGLWVEAVFAYFLGVSGFSTTLPNILAGVFGVGLLYLLVKKQMGELAGVTAALVLAITPVFLATNRNNTMDGMLVFTLLLAAWAFIQATEAGKLRWLLLGAFIVGLGFNIKMLQAFLPLPAFYALYFFGSREGWLKKILHLGMTTVLLIAVSLAWAVAVDLVPPEHRPYIGSSGNNTVMGLIFGHNGAARLERGGNAHQTGPQPGLPPQGGIPLQPAPPSQDGIPPQPALPPQGGIPPQPALPPQRGMPPQPGLPPQGGVPPQPNPRQQGPHQAPPPAALEACDGQTPGASCSFSAPNGHVINGQCITPPKTSELACAPTGMMPAQAPAQPNGVPFSNETGSPGVFRFFLAPLSKQMSWLLPFALFSVLFAAFGSKVQLPVEAGVHQALILWGGWLLTCVVFFSMISGIFHAYYAIMLAPPLGGMAGIGFAQLYRWGKVKTWVVAALILSVLVTLGFQLFAAAQYNEFAPWMLGTGILIGLGIMLMSISRRAAYAVILSAALVIPSYWSGMTVIRGENPHLPTAYQGQSGNGPQGAFLARPTQNPDGGKRAVTTELLDFLQAHTQDVKYLIAVPSSQQGAIYVIETGRPVLYMGGFGGMDEVVKADDLKTMVSNGELRYILYGGDRGNKPEIANWLASSCTVVEGIPLPQEAPGGPNAPQGAPAREMKLYECR